MKRVIFYSLFLLGTLKVAAQRAYISTDIVKWGMLAPNISTDIILSDRTSVNFEASANPLKDYKYRHVMLCSEYRVWMKRPLYSHYIGVNAMAATYDISYGQGLLCGDVIALGVGYGYSFILNERWNLIPCLGVGVGLISKVGDATILPRPVVTKLGVSVAYIID